MLKRSVLLMSIVVSTAAVSGASATSSAWPVCTLYEHASNATVALHASNAGVECPGFAKTMTRQSFGSSDGFWRGMGKRPPLYSTSAGNGVLTRVCRATLTKSGAYFIVSDTGGQSDGGEICHAYAAAAGWRVT